MDEAATGELSDRSVLRTDRVLPNQGSRAAPEVWAGSTLEPTPGRTLPFSPSQVVKVAAFDQNPSNHQPATA